MESLIEKIRKDRLLLRQIPLHLYTKEVIIAALANGGYEYRYLAKKFQCDPDVILAAVKSDPESIFFVDSNLYTPEVILYSSKSHRVLQEMPKLFLDFPDVTMETMLNFVSVNSTLYSKILSKYKNNEEITRMAIVKTPFNLSIAPSKFQNDRDFVLDLVKKHPELFQQGLISKTFLNDKEFARIALDANVSVIHIGSQLQNDGEFLRPYISKNPKGFWSNLSKREKKEFKPLMMYCVTHMDQGVIECYPQEMITKEMMEIALAGNKHNWKYFPLQLKKKPILMSLVRKYGGCKPSMLIKKLKEDEELLFAISRIYEKFASRSTLSKCMDVAIHF